MLSVNSLMNAAFCFSSVKSDGTSKRPVFSGNSYIIEKNQLFRVIFSCSKKDSLKHTLLVICQRHVDYVLFRFNNI